MSADRVAGRMLDVGLLGVSRHSEKTLRVYFERSRIFRFTAPDDAHCLIVDSDNHQAAALLADESGRRPDRPIILLTLNPGEQTFTSHTTLRKPVKIEALTQALLDVQAQLQPTPHSGLPIPVAADDRQQLSVTPPTPPIDPATAPNRAKADSTAYFNPSDRQLFIGNMPDVDLSNADERSRIFFRPDNYLLGPVRRAVQEITAETTIVCIHGPHFKTIYIDARRRMIGVPAPPPELHSIARLPLDPRNVRIDSAAASLPADEELHWDSIDGFLWRLALCASRGRLPEGTSLETPVVLAGWPNLPRLQVPPHAVRVISLWAKRATSLNKTPGLLDIPQRYVFGLYGACIAIGLVITIPEARLPEVVDTAPPPHQKRNLFRRLLDRLAGIPPTHGDNA